jgi:uncharacterized membrane protein
MFIFLFVCCMLVPGSMIGFGMLWKSNPPKNINNLYGYRTSMSMKNKDTWNYAHRYIGRIWYLLGIITAVLSVIILFIFKNSFKFESITIYLVFIQIALLCVGIIPTEISLNKNFDKKGKRK